MVRDFIDHLCAQTNRSGEPLAPNTIRWIMAPLKAMLADAYENGLVTVDASRVRVVVSDRGRARTLKPASKRLTGEQTVAILAAIPERYRLLFLLLACTGLRIAKRSGCNGRTSSRPPRACAKIRRQFYRGKLKEYPKTEAGDRRVAVIPHLSRELVRHRAASPHAGARDPIFATKYGTHISAHNIRRVLRPIVKDLALEWVTPHVFRHSLATPLRDAGYDANAIARVLGHSDPSFTQRTYIHEASIVRFDELLTASWGIKRTTQRTTQRTTRRRNRGESPRTPDRRPGWREMPANEPVPETASNRPETAEAKPKMGVRFPSPALIVRATGWRGRVRAPTACAPGLPAAASTQASSRRSLRQAAIARGRARPGRRSPARVSWPQSGKRHRNATIDVGEGSTVPSQRPATRMPGVSIRRAPAGRVSSSRVTVVWRPRRSEARTSPVFWRSSPSRVLTSVDLPEPEAPSSTVFAPGREERADDARCPRRSTR